MGVINKQASPRFSRRKEYLNLLHKHSDAMASYLKANHRESIATQKVENYFAAFADRYAIMLELVRKASPANLLSVGISYGLPEVVVAKELGIPVTGTDYRPEKMNVWASAAAANGVEIAAYDAVVDDRQILHNLGAFDMIWCCEVLEHLRIPPILVINDLCSCLTPGGKVLITVPNVGRFHNVKQLLKGENIVEPLANRSRSDLANGANVFESWIHVREPSIREMEHTLVEATPDSMHWDLWLPMEGHSWGQANLFGKMGIVAQKMFKRLRSTIFCLGTAK